MDVFQPTELRMLSPDINGLRSSNSLTGGIGQNTKKTSFGSKPDRTNTNDRFRQSAFQNTGLSGLYTSKGSMSPAFSTPKTTMSSFAPKKTGLFKQGLSAYQGMKTGAPSSKSTFPSPLATPQKSGLLSANSLFGTTNSATGSKINLIA